MGSKRDASGGGWRWVALAAGLVAGGSAVAFAADDLIDPLTLRVNDTRGVPGGQVTFTLRTYRSRPVKQGRLTVGAKPPTASPQRAGSMSRAAATSPLTACGAPHVFSVAGDVSPSGSFDSAAQEFSVDFSSASGSVNAADGVLAYFVCDLDAGLTNGEEFEITVEVGTDLTSLLDPFLGEIPVAPRPGRLRIVSSLSPELGVEDTEVKPGAVAQVEIGSKWPFAIESGVLELELADPSWMAGTPTVRVDDRHGSIVVDAVGVPEAGHVRIEFHSPDGDYNDPVPGTLFTVEIPTSAAVPLSTTGTVSFFGAESFLVAPGGGSLPAAFEPGSLTFLANPKTEDLFRDGFGTTDDQGAGTTAGWSQTGGS